MSSSNACMQREDIAHLECGLPAQGRVDSSSRSSCGIQWCPLPTLASHWISRKSESDAALRNQSVALLVRTVINNLRDNNDAGGTCRSHDLANPYKIEVSIWTSLESVIISFRDISHNGRACTRTQCPGPQVHA
jgi:hypothetical protein